MKARFGSIHPGSLFCWLIIRLQIEMYGGLLFCPGSKDRSENGHVFLSNFFFCGRHVSAYKCTIELVFSAYFYFSQFIDSGSASAFELSGGLDLQFNSLWDWYFEISPVDFFLV